MANKDEVEAVKKSHVMIPEPKSKQSQKPSK